MHNLISATKFFHMVIILVMIFVDLSYWRLLKKLKFTLVGFYILLNLALLQCHQLLEAILPEFFYQITEFEIVVLLALSYLALLKKTIKRDDQES